MKSSLIKSTLGCLLVASVAVASGNAVATTAKNTPNPAIASRENGGDCFFFNTIRNWRALDSTHMVVWAPGSKTPYLVTLTMPVFDLTSAWRVAFVDGNHDGNVCSFGRDRIVVPGGITTDSASIRGVSKLDDAGMAAIEQQYNLKLAPKKKGEQPSVEAAKASE
jgi:hypothetical protein